MNKFQEIINKIKGYCKKLDGLTISLIAFSIAIGTILFVFTKWFFELGFDLGVVWVCVLVIILSIIYRNNR